MFLIIFSSDQSAFEILVLETPLFPPEKPDSIWSTWAVFGRRTSTISIKIRNSRTGAARRRRSDRARIFLEERERYGERFRIAIGGVRPLQESIKRNRTSSSSSSSKLSVKRGTGDPKGAASLRPFPKFPKKREKKRSGWIKLVEQTA